MFFKRNLKRKQNGRLSNYVDTSTFRITVSEQKFVGTQSKEHFLITFQQKSLDHKY
jgi:hypothetical protein